MNNDEIAIIGAGNGGRAFAAYFADKGFKINLGFRTFSNIAEVIKKKEIISEGKISGTFPINKIDSDYAEIIKNTEIIFIVLPANVHSVVIKSIIPYLQNNQILLLNPGRTWGAIQIYNLIKRERPLLNIHVGETQTLLFTSRKMEDYGVSILKIKEKVNYCFYNSPNKYYIKKKFSEIIPELQMVDDIRITSLNNIGAMVHPATVLLNAGSIIRKTNFLFYREGTVEPISNVIKDVDLERVSIIKELKVKPLSFLKWVEEVYDIKANNYPEAFQKIPSYATIQAPKEIQMRYLTEDVPTGLVPLSSIGKYINLPTTAIDSLIELTDSLLGTNFKRTGRTVRNVNLPLKLLSRGKNSELSIPARTLIIL